MYCPECLPDGPRDASSLDPKTGKIVKASVESRYACANPDHKGHGSAQLEPLNNGTYKCDQCGWTNAPKPAKGK